MLVHNLKYFLLPNCHFWNYFKWLSYILIAKFVIMSAIIILGVVGLGPDEAQYWTWSRALDFGYYSKPPGIAWQIGLGTQIFGHNEYGVRFLSLLLSFLQAYAVFLLAAHADLKPRTSYWCGVMMALSPLGILGSLMAITDGGMLFFWTIASISLVSALRVSKAANPLIIGSCILCGALFKWPVYLFWLFYLIFWRRCFPQQKALNVLSGIAISLLGLLPSVWWNWTHDWATFRHVSSTLQGGQVKANFFEFVGSQALLMSPLLFGVFLTGIFYGIKQFKTLSAPLFCCGLISLSCLGLGTVLSLFQKIQGNWVVYAYPTAYVVTGWVINEEMRKLIWIKAGVILSACLTAALFFNPFSTNINPFKHNQGWKELNQVLTKIGYDPKKDFLASDKYQTTSILSFYSPEQKRAYFINLGGARKNQFSYWPGLESVEEKSGYFVWVENNPAFEREQEGKKAFYEKELKNYFSEVEFAGSELLIEKENRVIKGALFFKCSHCYKIPEETALW